MVVYNRYYVPKEAYYLAFGFAILAVVTYLGLRIYCVNLLDTKECDNNSGVFKDVKNYCSNYSEKAKNDICKKTIKFNKYFRNTSCPENDDKTMCYKFRGFFKTVEKRCNAEKDVVPISNKDCREIFKIKDILKMQKYFNNQCLTEISPFCKKCSKYNLFFQRKPKEKNKFEDRKPKSKEKY
jgi:hypothetical protein